MSILYGPARLTICSVIEFVQLSNFSYESPLPNLSANVLSYMVAPEILTKEIREMPLASSASKLCDTIETRKEEWLSSDRLDIFKSNIFAAMQMTSWSRFPIYDMDFGFGKPLLCTVNTFISFGNRLGKVYITPPFPNSPSSVATLYIWSTPYVLQALEQQSGFQALLKG